jgi:hypothetical protein
VAVSIGIFAAPSKVPGQEEAQMRCKPRSVAALQVALGGLPDSMQVEADKDIGVSAKTVGELRRVTAWSENHNPAGTISRKCREGEQGQRTDTHLA